MNPLPPLGLTAAARRSLAVSLTALATGFLRIAEHEVADAMRAHPELVSGTGRNDALLMRAVPTVWSAKAARKASGPRQFPA